MEPEVWCGEKSSALEESVCARPSMGAELSAQLQKLTCANAEAVKSKLAQQAGRAMLDT